MLENLMTVKDAAAFLKLSAGRIRQLCIKGELPGAQKVGNTWVIPRTSIEAYEPGPQGFAAVWDRRKAEDAALREEVAAAVSKAALAEGKEEG